MPRCTIFVMVQSVCPALTTIHVCGACLTHLYPVSLGSSIHTNNFRATETSVFLRCAVKTMEKE